MLIFCVFAVGILTVLLGGAQAYRRLNTRDQAAYTARTCTQLLATKVRQAAGWVYIEAFGDGDALVLAEEIEGTVYLDRIYCHDGWLMELYAADEDGWLPQDGERLLALEGLSLEWEGSLLRAEVQLEDDIRSMLLQPRVEAEVQP